MSWLVALAGIALVVAGATTASAAARCELPPGFAPQGRIESGGVVVVFRTVPATIEVGRHFAIDAVVCAVDPPRALAVDAQMPEHRHGMNYRAHVSATGPGRYRAEGLLFHMPGRWQLRFDVERDGRRKQLATDILLE